MQQDILINWSPQETRVAVVENGAVQELHVERTLERGLMGNVYLGKVARVLPGMQSAFIDIGLERSAFLHVADLWQRPLEGESLPANRHGAPQRPIEKQVFEGQTLMVQVIKDPIGTKGARLSTQVSIAGRMLVFLPQDDHIGVSQKIAASLRDELRALSGRTHRVLTAVAVQAGGARHAALSRSQVRFARLSEVDIAAYLASGEWQGKAGGYGIQGRAAGFIEHISGSYSGIMGLPLYESKQLLSLAGIQQA